MNLDKASDRRCPTRPGCLFVYRIPSGGQPLMRKAAWHDGPNLLPCGYEFNPAVTEGARKIRPPWLTWGKHHSPFGRRSPGIADGRLPARRLAPDNGHFRRLCRLRQLTHLPVSELPRPGKRWRTTRSRQRPAGGWPRPASPTPPPGGGPAGGRIEIDPPCHTERSLSTLLRRAKAPELTVSLVDPDGCIAAASRTVV